MPEGYTVEEMPDPWREQRERYPALSATGAKAAN